MPGLGFLSGSGSTGGGGEFFPLNILPTSAIPKHPNVIIKNES